MRFAALLFVCIIARAAEAVTVIDPVSPPPGLAPGSVYQRIAVTPTAFGITTVASYPPLAGTVGGLAGADYDVTLLAFRAGELGFRWFPEWDDWDGSAVPFHAILSDGTTNARDRVTIAGPIFNMANQLIATDAADLWDGSIANPIRYDEFGNSVSEGTRVWTGTTGNGTRDANNTAGSWINPQSVGRAGDPWANNFNWINKVGLFGNTSARLYALSPALVVPQPGDFNGNGTVDAADYAVWRKTDGTPANYDLWRAHFGESISGSGAASGERTEVRGTGERTEVRGTGERTEVRGTAGVPEPATLCLATFALVFFMRRTKVRLTRGTDFSP